MFSSTTGTHILGTGQIWQLKLCVLFRNGKVEDVVCGFDSMLPYATGQSPYMGAVVGRVANRVHQAQFELDGQKYHLAANDGPNSLHGGKRGFDKVQRTITCCMAWCHTCCVDRSMFHTSAGLPHAAFVPHNLHLQTSDLQRWTHHALEHGRCGIQVIWDARYLSHADGQAMVLTYTSPDGEEVSALKFCETVTHFVRCSLHLLAPPLTVVFCRDTREEWRHKSLTS